MGVKFIRLMARRCVRCIFSYSVDGWARTTRSLSVILFRHLCMLLLAVVVHILIAFARSLRLIPSYFAYAFVAGLSTTAAMREMQLAWYFVSGD